MPAHVVKNTITCFFFLSLFFPFFVVLNFSDLLMYNFFQNFLVYLKMHMFSSLLHFPICFTCSLPARACLQRVFSPKEMERSTIACTRYKFTISRDIHTHHLTRIRRQVSHHVPFVRRPDTDIAVKSGCDEEHA